MASHTTKKPLVSIVTVHYNQPLLTKQLLDSLRQISYSSVEVWVVDNGSMPTHSVDSLIEVFPEVNFIKSAVNLGFAGGNNLVLDKAKGDYVLFLNNDTEVATDFIEPLVSRFQSDDSIGMVSPKIKYYERPELIQYAGSTEINMLTGQGHFIGHQQPDQAMFDHSTPTAYIHGAAMMVSSKLIASVGPMNEDYFLYYEELDWCARAKRAGFTVWYESASVVWHKESMSTGKASPLKAYYQIRNRLRFIYSNASTFDRVLGVCFTLAIALPKNVIMHWLDGRPDLSVAVWDGAKDFLFPTIATSYRPTATHAPIPSVSL